MSSSTGSLDYAQSKRAHLWGSFHSEDDFSVALKDAPSCLVDTKRSISSSSRKVARKESKAKSMNIKDSKVNYLPRKKSLAGRKGQGETSTMQHYFDLIYRDTEALSVSDVSIEDPDIDWLSIASEGTEDSCSELARLYAKASVVALEKHAPTKTKRTRRSKSTLDTANRKAETGKLGFSRKASSTSDTSNDEKNVTYKSIDVLGKTPGLKRPSSTTPNSESRGALSMQGEKMGLPADELSSVDRILASEEWNVRRRMIEDWHAFMKDKRQSSFKSTRNSTDRRTGLSPQLSEIDLRKRSDFLRQSYSLPIQRATSIDLSNSSTRRAFSGGVFPAGNLNDEGMLVNPEELALRKRVLALSLIRAKRPGVNHDVSRGTHYGL